MCGAYGVGSSGASVSHGSRAAMIVSASGSVSSSGSSGGPHAGGGASTYGAGSPAAASSRNAVAGGMKRPREASHSDTATITNAADINETMTVGRKCDTPATTATATISTDSAASRKTTAGTSRR